MESINKIKEKLIKEQQQIIHDQMARLEATTNRSKPWNRTGSNARYR